MAYLRGRRIVAICTVNTLNNYSYWFHEHENTNCSLRTNREDQQAEYSYIPEHENTNYPLYTRVLRFPLRKEESVLAKLDHLIKVTLNVVVENHEDGNRT